VLDDPQKLAKVFASANAVVRPLLQSPLHRIVSGRLMLLNYTGGKTGNQYFTIGYFAWDDGDVLVSSSVKWPKTFGNARDVRLLIKGQWFTPADGDQGARTEGGCSRRVRPTQRSSGRQGLDARPAGRPSAGSPTVLEAGAKTTFIRFALAPETETP
jgi:hypothetical protein